MSIVEETLRSQRDSWREISDRVARIDSQEFPTVAPKRIILFGVGSSYFAARLTGMALIRDRSRVPRVPVIACPSQAIGQEVIPGHGDWAFAFSHRGKSGVTNAALEDCERSGAFTTLICGKDVEAPRAAKAMLTTVPQERVEPHTASVTGAICAATTLLLGARALEEWDAVCSVGDPDLELMKRRAGQGPSVIVGEWEGEWMAREGALKLMEMAKLPVRAFSSEEFFHGARLSVKPEDRVWHVSLPKDPRNADFEKLRPHHTIGIYGATPLAWVPALVELQWLALATSLNLGVNPDV